MYLVTGTTHSTLHFTLWQTCIPSLEPPTALYTSPFGRPVSRHWNHPQHFTLHPLADLYLVTGTTHSTLHFTLWQTCIPSLEPPTALYTSPFGTPVSRHWNHPQHFTLHPLADLYLVTGTTHSTLHFTLWQTCIPSLEPPTALYTSPFGRPVSRHWNHPQHFTLHPLADLYPVTGTTHSTLHFTLWQTCIPSLEPPTALYTSPFGRPVSRHWNHPQHFTLHPLADLYPVTGITHSTLHFTLWQTCIPSLEPPTALYTSLFGRPVSRHWNHPQHFTLHPLADLYLVTGATHSTLHFILWQTCIPSLEPPTALYTSPFGRPVSRHWNHPQHFTLHPLADLYPVTGITHSTLHFILWQTCIPSLEPPTALYTSPFGRPVSRHWNHPQHFTLHPLADLYLVTGTTHSTLHFTLWQTCIPSLEPPTALYTSPFGRPVSRHWNHPQHFTLHPLADLYPVTGTTHSTLHFTLWQTCIPSLEPPTALYTSPFGRPVSRHWKHPQHFTLHPLADMYPVTGTTHSTLHFTLWQTCISSLEPPTALYTSPFGRPVSRYWNHPQHFTLHPLADLYPVTGTTHSTLHFTLWQTCISSLEPPTALYTSPFGRPVSRHWNHPQHFTLHLLADMYLVTGTTHSTLHFTLWQTCIPSLEPPTALYTSPFGRPVSRHWNHPQHFTLHPLADLYPVTGTTHSTLHFTLWQTCIPSLEPPTALYTSPLGRPARSNTNSTSVRSIQPCCNYCAKTTQSRIFNHTADRT